MALYRGGRTVYGQSIGILLTDSRFPRIPGDVGNASTFDFPVHLRRVVVPEAESHELEEDARAIPAYVAAARELEAAGVRAITTSCGYFTTFQEALCAAVTVPVFTSSLMLVPMVARMLPTGRRVGILTIHSRRLTARVLAAAGITDEPVVIMGAEEVPAFTDTYPRGAMQVDPEAVERGVVGMVRDLVRQHPDVGAIVCEGINFAPYAAAVQEVTALPWFDIVDLVRLVHGAVVKKPYRGFL